MPKRDGLDYWVEVKPRYRTPKPYCWEIYHADRLQAVQRSVISYKTEAMARIDGESALRQMLEKLHAFQTKGHEGGSDSSVVCCCA
jgi:hypothetical protein